jgi:Protein of unknown function (DUF4019)
MIARIGLGIVLMAALAVAIPAHAQSPEDAAQAAATQWLTLLDNGQYAATWEQAAQVFKRAVTLAQWEQAVSRAREPFGKFVSRKVKSRTFATALPGAPDGKYVTVVFESAFERKAAAVETAVMTLDPDGAWRIAGSFIR